MRILIHASRLAAAAASATIGLFLAVPPAAAQTVPLANVLPELILREIVLDSPPISGIYLGVQVPDNFTHVAHFSPLQSNDLNNPVVGIIQGFNTQLATQFATFPLGSSTGGFTYTFDESVGTFQRRSRSFGPLFGERALTIGRGKLSVGFNYQHSTFDTFEGENLRDGSIKFYLRHEDCCDVVFTPAAPIRLLDEPNGTVISPPFENDLIEASLSVKATSDTAAFFANYGVTDRWDVGLAVPVVSVNLDAAVTARILRFNTLVAPTIHAFDMNDTDATLTVRSGGRATGIGDVVLRTKYLALRLPGGGVAGAVDVRLPTGNEQDLLGTGGTQTKLALVVSGERGPFGHHAVFGYTASSGDVAGTMPGLIPTSVPDEINYSGGVEAIAGPRLTLNLDVIGRTLRDAGRLRVAGKEFPLTLLQSGNCENTFFDCTSMSFDEFEPRRGDLTLVLGAAGAKVNVSGNLLVSGSLLFPLTKAGLRSRVTTVVGLDYTF